MVVILDKVRSNEGRRYRLVWGMMRGSLLGGGEILGIFLYPIWLCRCRVWVEVVSISGVLGGWGGVVVKGLKI